MKNQQVNQTHNKYLDCLHEKRAYAVIKRKLTIQVIKKKKCPRKQRYGSVKKGENYAPT